MRVIDLYSSSRNESERRIRLKTIFSNWSGSSFSSPLNPNAYPSPQFLLEFYQLIFRFGIAYKSAHHIVLCELEFDD